MPADFLVLVRFSRQFPTELRRQSCGLLRDLVFSLELRPVLKQGVHFPRLIYGRKLFFDSSHTRLVSFAPADQITARVLIGESLALFVRSLHIENLQLFDRGHAPGDPQPIRNFAQRAQQPVQRRRIINAHTPARFVPRRFANRAGRTRRDPLPFAV